MINIPVICKGCKTIFPSGLIVSNFNISMNNLTIGPCPNCGSDGKAPDGYFNFLEKTLNIFSSSQLSKDELIRFKEYLRYNQVDTKEELQEIINEQIPQMSKILEVTRSEDFRFWITTILAILSIIISLMSSNDSPSITNINNIEMNEIINQIYIEQTNILTIEKADD